MFLYEKEDLGALLNGTEFEGQENEYFKTFANYKEFFGGKKIPIEVIIAGNNPIEVVEEATKRHVQWHYKAQKEFLVIKKIVGSGWFTYVFSFKFVTFKFNAEDPDKSYTFITYVGTTDFLEVLEWLALYKRALINDLVCDPIKSIENIFVGGQKVPLKNLAHKEVALYRPFRPQEPSDLDLPVKVLEQSRLDLLTEGKNVFSNFFATENTVNCKIKCEEEEEVIKDLIKDFSCLNLKKNKPFENKRILDMRNICAEVRILKGSSSPKKVIRSRLLQLGIVNTLNDSTYTERTLQSTPLLTPITFVIYNQNLTLDLCKFQRKAAEDGFIVILWEDKKIENYFVLGSSYCFFHTFKFITCFFDEIYMSTITSHYYEKYRYARLESNRKSFLVVQKAFAVYGHGDFFHLDLSGKLIIKNFSIDKLNSDFSKLSMSRKNKILKKVFFQFCDF
jgi:hypothetical protein